MSAVQEAKNLLEPCPINRMCVAADWCCLGAIWPSLLMVPPLTVLLPFPLRLMQSAHLAVIDALMAVGAMETVAAVKQQGSAEQLGGACSWEDALLYWVNLVRTERGTMFVSSTYCCVFCPDVSSFNTQNSAKLQAFLTIFSEPSQLNQKLRERTQESQTDTSQDNTEPQPVQPSVSIALHIRCRNCHIPHSKMLLQSLRHNTKSLLFFCNMLTIVIKIICIYFFSLAKIFKSCLYSVNHLTRLVS